MCGREQETGERLKSRGFPKKKKNEGSDPYFYRAHNLTGEKICTFMKLFKKIHKTILTCTSQFTNFPPKYVEMPNSFLHTFNKYFLSIDDELGAMLG